MTVDQYLSSQGTTPLSLEEYQQTLVGNLTSAQLEELQRLFANYAECGNKQSTYQFHLFAYGTRLDDGTPLYQLWQRCFLLPFLRAILPPLCDFCQEVGTPILDAGCGNALLLGYLAINNPNTAFTGVDHVADAIQLAEERISRMNLRNVSLLCRNCYQLGSSNEPAFDAVIMANALDDDREPYSQFIEARFETTAKMAAISEVLRPGGKIWLSLMPFPAYTDAFGERLTEDICLAGFAVRETYPIEYQMLGKDYQHWVWILQSDE